MPERLLPYSAHVDGFARARLPRASDWPRMFFALPELHYAPRVNAGVELLDKAVARGWGGRACLRFGKDVWSYADLLAKANKIARVLTEDYGLKPGNRVLLRAANNPMMVASWFAVIKAGGIAVATMPLLRAKELTYVLEKAQVGLALCDARLVEEMEKAKAAAPVCRDIAYFNTDATGGLESRMATKPATFDNCDTSLTDVALIAFTSGTTGNAKGTMHFHRDLLAICDAFPRYVLRPNADDIFTGSPPLAFTFGLGGLVTFPMRFGASTALAEKATPDLLPQIVQDHKASILFTAPTAYRALADNAPKSAFASLRKGVSAGEHLPKAIFDAWYRFSGLKLFDGLGATEMLHIFVSARQEDIVPGATGKAIPGYAACILDDEGNVMPPGEVGRLAVRGPTGCRYLDDPARQHAYVQNGWNLTGDAYRMDENGYFWYQARTDDMIVTAGYNVSGPEVEGVLLDHPKVKECAVIGAPDAERGTIVKAYVVLRDPKDTSPETVKALQDHVKATIAPYKYPRNVEFVTELPRTETGKVQRFKLRQQAESS
jgi:2-aminobenzoate-CoA ligase